MNADSKQIHADFLYKDLTYKVRGAIFAVYNELGFGHKEEIYQKALGQEFHSQNIIFEPQTTLAISYRDITVGNYKPDFLIDQKIIIEIKSVPLMPASFEKQLLYYLKATGCELGLLVNFGAPRLLIKRIILTSNKKKIGIRENPCLPAGRSSSNLCKS